MGFAPFMLPPATIEPWGACKPAYEGCQPIAASAAAGPYAHRAAPLPFTPEEPAVSPLRLPVRGTFAGTLEDTRAGAPFHLEDNFSTGLSRWAGATEDWRLDAAGVRPCSLALFGPSLGARDYVLEFLAKVEQRCHKLGVPRGRPEQLLRREFDAQSNGRAHRPSS